MCYNYEYMIERGVKRANRERGEKIDFNELSASEKKILDDNARRLTKKFPAEVVENVPSSEVASSSETISSFPGQETIIIPITTKQREAYIFGFVPDWSKSLKDAKANYNCRSETILEKPTWKKAFIRAQRCLVPAAAFYETDRATKKRYRFTVKDEPEIFYAGIFNHWTDKETGEIFKTFAIITREANELVRIVWERMPVILNAEAQQIWMNIESAVPECISLFTAYPAHLMECTEALALQRRKKSEDNLSLDL